MARRRTSQRNTALAIKPSGECAYFDSAGGLTLRAGQIAEDDTLIKNALLLVEGTHKDNKGVVHEFPVQRIQRLVDNTNTAIAQGYEVPFMADHSKELLSSVGHLKRLGGLASNLECRVITAQDLPNPKMQHLLGKLGAFAKVAVKNRVDDVKKGLIKLLSPGVDLLNERIAEVSAVAFPAIHGPALFAAQFSLDYDEAKEQAEAIKKQRNQAQDCFNILFSVLQSIDAVPQEQMMGVDPKGLKRQAVEKFNKDLIELLDIEADAESPLVQNPTELARVGAQYSSEEPDESDVPGDEPEEVLQRKRRKKVDFTMASSARVLAFNRK